MTVPWFAFAAEYSASGGTPIQKFVAFTLFVILLAVVVGGLVRAGYRHLSDQQREDKAGVRAAVGNTDPVTFALDAAAVRREGVTTSQRESLASFIGGLGTQTPTVGPREPASTRDALGRVRQAYRDALGSRLDAIPRATLRGLRWAVLVSVLGATAIHASLVARWLSAQGGGPGFSIAKAAQNTITYTQDAIATGADVLTVNPVFDLLWSLGLTAVLMGGEWIYARWYVVASILLLAAAAAYLLDSRTPTEAGGGRILARWQLAGGAAAATIALWFIGVVPVVIGRQVGAPDWGAAAGLALGLLAVAWTTIGLIAWTAWSTYREATRQQGRDEAVLATLVVERVVDAGAVVAAALTPVYLVVIVADGAIGTLLGALGGAPWYILLAIAVVVLSAGGGLAWALRDHWADIRAGFADVAGRQQVRAILFTQAFPILGAASAAVVVLAFTESLPASVVGGLLAGIGLHRGYQVSKRIRYRAYVYEPPGNEPSRLLVQGRYLDIDGGQYHVRVNGTDAQLHPDPDRLLEDLVVVIESVAREGEPAPTESDFHAEFASDVGITDIDESRAKIRERVRQTLILKGVEADGRLSVVETHDNLDEEFPEEFWRPVWNERRSDEIRVFGDDWQLWRYDAARDEPVRDLGSSPIEVLKT